MPRSLRPRPAAWAYFLINSLILLSVAFAFLRAAGPMLREATLAVVGLFLCEMFWRMWVQFRCMRWGEPLAAVVSGVVTSNKAYWGLLFGQHAVYRFQDPFNVQRRGFGRDYTGGLVAGDPVLVFYDRAHPSCQTLEETSAWTLSRQPASQR